MAFPLFLEDNKGGRQRFFFCISFLGAKPLEGEGRHRFSQIFGDFPSEKLSKTYFGKLPLLSRGVDLAAGASCWKLIITCPAYISSNPYRHLGKPRRFYLCSTGTKRRHTTKTQRPKTNSYVFPGIHSINSNKTQTFNKRSDDADTDGGGDGDGDGD